MQVFVADILRERIPLQNDLFLLDAPVISHDDQQRYLARYMWA
ncbi:hypothetical protein ULF88_20470 [Halopseudomonas pachastrellae]|nr:hypothetical protein [Halopseudomonas pachastrellae]